MVEIYFVLFYFVILLLFMPLERGARGARFYAFCFYLFLVLNRPYICRKKDWAGSSLETLTPNLEISDKRVTHSLITHLYSVCFHLFHRPHFYYCTAPVRTSHLFPLKAARVESSLSHRIATPKICSITSTQTVV